MYYFVEIFVEFSNYSAWPQFKYRFCAFAYAIFNILSRVENAYEEISFAYLIFTDGLYYPIVSSLSCSIITHGYYAAYVG